MANEKDLSIIRFKKENSFDINSEITLEDYKPDIKKLLHCKETVLAPSKYVSKDGIELEGTVNYGVTYLGTDNHLYSTSFTEEYSLSGRSENGIRGDDISDHTVVWSEGVTLRLLSPRKFSLRNKILSRSLLTSTMEKDDCVSERFIPSECEYQTFTAKGITTFSASGEIVELCDEYIPRSDTERIISSEASVFISDVHADDGRISVRGELIADILACDDEGFEMPYTVRRKIPFSQETEHPDVCKGDKLSASGICTELKVLPEESRVLICAYCCFDYSFSKITEESVCTDAFSPLHALKLTDSKIRYVRSAHSANGNISISTSYPLADIGISPSFTGIYAIGSANVTDFSSSAENGKGTIFGECKFRTVFYSDTNEIPEYESKDVTVPFKYEFSFESTGEQSLWCSNPTLSRISLRTDGEKLAIDAELSVTFTVICESERAVISDITVGEKKKEPDNCIRIVYPQKGETLWTLAKKTSTRISHICKSNGIQKNDQPSSPDSLASCRFLLI